MTPTKTIRQEAKTVHQYHRIVRAAEACGIDRSTLRSAVERGDIPAVHTGCGAPLVRLADVREYMRGEHPGGQYGRRAAWRTNA